MNYSASCRSNPGRLSFIFGTQIKIFSNEVGELSVYSLTAMQLTLRKVKGVVHF